MDSWGRLPGGETVWGHQLRGPNGASLTVISYGARITDLRVRLDQRSLVLGYDELSPYLSDEVFLGASIGRYANRIAGGRAALDGREHHLTTSPGTPHQLHGGPEGFHRRNWQIDEAGDTSIRMSLVSPDNDQGFPGRLRASVEYELGTLEDGATEVTVTYRADTDEPTWVSLTQHSYWNLDGPGESVSGHRLRVAADHYLPVDADGIPTGALAEVEGPWDLRADRLLSEVIAAPALSAWGGLDHNFVLADDPIVARLTSADGRVRLEVETDRPGLQVYTANSFPAGPWPKYGGIALETQAHPDSPHHPEWPSTVLGPGEEYQTVTRWRISVE